MGRARQHHRLGEHHRAERKKASSAAEIVSGLRQMHGAALSGASWEHQLDLALGRLASLAELPLQVFAEAGLPNMLGTYAVLPDGTYYPVSVRRAPGEALEAAGPAPENLTGIVSLQTIGYRFPADSRIGFATVILEAIEDVRSQLRIAADAGDAAQVNAINKAMTLMFSHQNLQREFIDGPDIQSTRAQRPARSQAGVNRGAVIAEARRAKIAVWQPVAEAIWAVDSDLKIIDVARRVKLRLKDGASIQVIRKAIKKPGK